MIEPDIVGVAGDWHGNRNWAIFSIEKMAAQLPEPKIILHCGDFGIWPGKLGREYLVSVVQTLRACKTQLFFAEGNHEDYAQLPELEIVAEDQILGWLPRNYRWAWHGREWLALGGAASVDKVIRTPYADWWPEEEITYKQAAEVCQSGHADVMVCHDAPTGVPLVHPTPPHFWDKQDIRRSERHQDLLREIVLSVEPQYLMHGHHHQGAPEWREVDMPYGNLSVASLNTDGFDTNWGILDVRDMKWVPRADS